MVAARPVDIGMFWPEALSGARKLAYLPSGKAYGQTGKARLWGTEGEMQTVKRSTVLEVCWRLCYEKRIRRKRCVRLRKQIRVAAILKGLLVKENVPIWGRSAGCGQQNVQRGF